MTKSKFDVKGNETAPLGGEMLRNGVVNGEYAATLSDTVELPHPGWICPTLLDGTIVYTTVNGEKRTRTFTKDTVSVVRVKQVWSTGTTANMGIVVYY